MKSSSQAYLWPSQQNCGCWLSPQCPLPSRTMLLQPIFNFNMRMLEFPWAPEVKRILFQPLVTTFAKACLHNSRNLGPLFWRPLHSYIYFGHLSCTRFDFSEMIASHDPSLHRLCYSLVKYSNQLLWQSFVNVSGLDGLDVLKVFTTHGGLERTSLAQRDWLTSALLGQHRDNAIFNV